MFPDLTAPEWIESLEALPEYKVIFADENIDLYPRYQEWFPVRAGRKAFDDLGPILRVLGSQDLREHEKVLVVGGASIQDLCGTALGLYHRGLSWDYAPTTIVGMADSCLGGKGAIHGEFKDNIIGVVHPPRRVFQYWDFIETLPKEEVLSGLGEIVKTHFVYSGIYKAHGLKISRQLVRQNLRYRRQLLDRRGDTFGLIFGHIFGFPLERILEIPHGISVLWGMDISAFVSEKLGRIKNSRPYRDLFQSYLNDPIVFPDLSVYLKELRRYKRCYSDQCRFILISGDGKVEPAWLNLNSLQSFLGEYISEKG